jgi:hypothetical protein
MTQHTLLVNANSRELAIESGEHILTGRQRKPDTPYREVELNEDVSPNCGRLDSEDSIGYEIATDALQRTIEARTAKAEQIQAHVEETDPEELAMKLENLFPFRELQTGWQPVNFLIDAFHGSEVVLDEDQLQYLLQDDREFWAVRFRAFD